MNTRLYKATTEYTAMNQMIRLLGKRAVDLNSKAIIFCPDKTGMMLEYLICEKLGGSFNTDVYSFDRFLRNNKNIDNHIGRDGAVMVLRKVIANESKPDDLKCFSNKSSNTLSENMYDLIAQLKSANVLPSDLKNCSDRVGGLFKDKLHDIAKIYADYQKEIESKYIDDGTYLSLLPDVIRNSDKIKGADVYFIGYDSWTKQMCEDVKAVFEVAKSVTAIFVGGENNYVYTNSMIEVYENICKELSISCDKYSIEGERNEINEESLKLIDALFNPKAESKNGKCKCKTDKIKINQFNDVDKEVEYVARIIRKKILSGARYSDFTICTGNIEVYEKAIRKYFADYEINYNLDESITFADTIVGRLVLSYIELFKHNFKREDVMKFIRNPLYNQKGAFYFDDFDNYLLKSGVYGYKMNEEFKLDDRNKDTFEVIRKEFISIRKEIKNTTAQEYVKVILDMLKALKVDDNIIKLCDKLNKDGLESQASLNKQAYEYLTTLLENCQNIMGDANLSSFEFYKILYLGMVAKKISVIPQYKDAVFIGDFKQTGINKAKYLFIIGLDDTMPINNSDICLLNDKDIDSLEKLNVVVNPTIKFVNQKERQNFALAFTSFSDELYLSYSSTVGDKEKTKSMVFDYILDNFIINKTTTRGSKIDEYLTKSAGKKHALLEIGEYMNDNVNIDCKTINSFNDALKASNDDLSVIVKDKIARDKNENKNLDQNLVKKVVTDSIGITGIESFYSCPYKYFVDRVLNLQDRETANIPVTDTGTLLHSVYQEFMGKVNDIVDKNLSDALENKEVEEVAKEAIKKSFCTDEFKRYAESTGLSNYVISMLKEESIYNCKKLYAHIKNSKFRVNTVETSVRGDAKNGLVFKVDDEHSITIKGRIDRTDCCTYNGKTYYRIIDYKSGSNVEYNYSNLASGKKLQLFLYAKALSNEDNNEVVGTYYYQSNIDFSDVSEDKCAELIGVTVDDENYTILQLSDVNLMKMVNGNPTIQSSYVTTELKYNEETGAYEHDNSKRVKNVVSKAEFSAMTDYAKKMAEQGIKHICNGNKMVTPYKGSCDYCPYSAMCLFEDGITGEYRAINGASNECKELIGIGTNGAKNGKC